MKSRLFFGFVATSVVATSLLFTACDSEKDLDVNNPDQTQLDESWTKQFGAIDPNQDWSLATTAKAKISVSGLDGLAEYQLQFYTDNPITSSSAKLMASKKVTTDAYGAASAEFTVDITKGPTVYYAGYVDKDNRRCAKAVALVDGVIDAQFGTAASSGAKMVSRGSTDADNVVVPNVSDPSSEVNGKYGQAVEVNASNSNNNVEGSADYATVLKISGSWNGNISVLTSEAQWARTLYVDGTWTLGNGEQKLGGNGLIVVRNGGKIVIPSGSALTSANAGRIVVLNGGTIEGNGSLTFYNGSANSYDYIAAGATVNIGTLNNNGGEVYNYGTLTVNELQGGAGKSIYVNHSKMTVDHSTYGSTTSNTRILTDCQLNVKQNLCCRNISMGNPSYVYVGGNLLMTASFDDTTDASEILMDANALLTVDGGVALNNSNIVGPTSGWAVCEFGQIGDPTGIVASNYTTSWATGSEQVVAGYVINNLYISIDKTETIDNYYSLTPYGKFTLIMQNGRLYDVDFDATNNWAMYPKYKEGAQVGNGNAVIVKKGEANITIPSGDCVPGYTSSKGSLPEPDPNSFIIACEDLGSTADMDYNDVVFSVAHVAGQNYMTVTPLAAGGTLASSIKYGNETIGEIHNMFNVSNTAQMINTLSENPTMAGNSVTVTVPEDWSFTANYNKFSVVTTTNDNESKFVTAPTTGKAPFMIIVPGTWCWPLEKVEISDAYSNFKDWSQDAAIQDAWTKNKVTGSTVIR